MRLDDEEARRRLEGAVVGRLATADADGVPHVVAAVFAVEGDQLYIAVDRKPKRSANLKRIRNIQVNPKVTFLVDHYEDDWSALWWVRADGTGRIIDDPEGMRGPIDLLVEKYAQYKAEQPDGPVIAITIDRLTGWSGAN
jgi:PPOX class probable F420-dependent enzyme